MVCTQILSVFLSFIYTKTDIIVAIDQHVFWTKERKLVAMLWLYLMDTPAHGAGRKEWGRTLVLSRQKLNVSSAFC